MYDIGDPWQPSRARKCVTVALGHPEEDPKCDRQHDRAVSWNCASEKAEQESNARYVFGQCYITDGIFSKYG